MRTPSLFTGHTVPRLASFGGSPERNLWLAVVALAIQNDEPDQLVRWLRSGDGREVCALAGLSPEWVERCFGQGEGFVRHGLAA